MKNMIILVLCIGLGLSVAGCGTKDSGKANSGAEVAEQKTITEISGEFTATVRDVIPDYCRDDFTPQVAVLTEYQCYPFTVYVGEDIGSKLEKGTTYVFSIEPIETEYSLDELENRSLPSLSGEISVTDVRIASENEMGLASLTLTYSEKTDN